MKTVTRIIAGILACLVIFPFIVQSIAQAAQPKTPQLHLRADQTQYLLGTYLEYLEDPGGKLSLAEVSTGPWATRFQRGQVETLNFGLSNSVYWLRLRVRNEAPAEIDWRLELARPSMNTVIFYHPDPAGGYTAHETGYIYPFSTREIPFETFVFNLHLPPGAEETIYLRVKDKTMGLPLHIWQSRALEQHNQTTTLLNGLSFGALLIMLAFNLIMSLVLHEKSHLIYLLFLLAAITCLASLQAYAQHYLWPNQTWINTFIIPLSISLSVLFALLFAGEFFQIHQQPRNWLITFKALVSLLSLSALATPFAKVDTLTASLPLALLAFLYATLLAIRAWWQNSRPARLYLFSWTIYFIPTMTIIIERMGFFTLPLGIADQMLQFSLVYMVAFQSLALVDRFNLYREETISTQKALVDQQNEALRLQDTLNRTLEQARLDLEQKVAERTQALHQLNQELAREVEIRIQAQQEAEYLARVDPLTGLFNRRHFSWIIEKELKRAQRYELPLSILILDIDLFKNINDTFGHQIGDLAINHIALILQNESRTVDILARYGGEEFVILLPETTCNEAQVAAERLRALIESASLEIDGHLVRLTVSIGVAGLAPASENDDFENLLKQADEALYQAKNTGRNRVMMFGAQPG